MLIGIGIYLFIGFCTGMFAIWLSLQDETEDDEVTFFLVVSLVMIVYWLPAFIMSYVINKGKL